MTWSQDWADGGISLTKSNQSKSKQIQSRAERSRAVQAQRRAGQRAHGSWRVQAKGSWPRAGHGAQGPLCSSRRHRPMPAFISSLLVRCLSAWPASCSQLSKCSRHSRKTSARPLQSPPLPLPFPQRGQSAVSSSSTMQSPCCPPTPAALAPPGRSGSLSVCHKSWSHRPISPVRLMIPCRRCPMGPSRARFGPAHLLHEIPNIRY
ncbi:hypothetical protein F5883DRAFT_12337 [Diaporthe sp. PMI_573]|nr:hypothetical protein F5883DRAFT_12337 [Diaporthaceae sp. PMI_573]